MNAKPANAKTKINFTPIHIIVIFFMMFGFGFLPPIGTITPLGMKILGIFIGLLYGWSTCGMLWTSLLGIFALGTSGAGTVKAMVTTAFSNEIVFFLIFILVLVQMLTETGAVNSVVGFIITRKSLQGKPWLFSFTFLLAAGLLCTFGQAFAGFFLCWGILETLFKKVGYKPFEIYPAIMLVGVVVSTSAVGIMFPFKNTPLLLFGTYSGLTGQQVNYFQYMLVMIPAGLIFLVGYLLLSKVILRPNMAPMVNMKIDEIVNEEDRHVTKRQKACLISFAVVLLTLLIPGCLPTSWALAQWMNSVGVAGLMIACTIAFILIKVDGEPLLDFSKCAKSGMNWPIIFMVAVLLTMTSLLMSEAAGIKGYIVTILNPLFNNLSGMTMLLILFFIGIVLTNFMNNMVVGFMLIPVLVAVSDTLPFSVVSGVLLIILAAHSAYLTPAASPAAAMLFAKTDWMRGSDIIKIGAIAIIVSIIAGLIAILGLGSLVF